MTNKKLPPLVSDSPIEKIAINLIKLDKENPRIQFLIDNLIASGHKTDEITKDHLILGLKNKQGLSFESLKNSIESRGLMDPIWVYRDTDDKYTVIEGNTRKLVFDELSDKYPNEERWQYIESRVLPRNVLTEEIDFIRLESHLGGKKAWDPYERAKYLYDLSEKGYSRERLARESRRTISTITEDIKAFEIMKKHFLPFYSDTENPLEKFSYFVELGKKKVNNLLLTKKFTPNDYCSWVADGKIPRAIDVRHLPEIFSNDEVKEAFIKRGYDEAMDLLSIIKPNITSPLFRDIERVIHQLNNLKLEDINEINTTPAKKGQLNSLLNTIYMVIGKK